MTAPEEPDIVEWDDQANALLRALLHYQAAHQAWITAPEAMQAAQRSRVKHSLEILWPLLDTTLAPVARSWSVAYRQRSPGALNYSAATTELTVILCIEMIDTIPRLTFEPRRNPAPLLRTIARRRSVDEYRRWSRATDAGERAPPTSDPDHEVQRTPRIREISLDDILLSALVEASSLSGGAFEAALIEQLDRQALFHQIALYWNRELTAEDWLLVQERYIKDPPTPYDELVGHLGTDWSSVRARKRLSRILERTAAFLQTSGLWPGADG